MKHLFFFLTCFLLLIACSSDPSQSAFPKQLPVDNRAEQEVATQNDEHTQLLATIKSATLQKEAINGGLEDGSIKDYVVRDGDGAFIAESTTYYIEEAKKNACKTKIIYITGGSTDVYWLKDQLVLVHRDNYDYLFKNNEFVTALKDGVTIEVTTNELQEATKIPATASKIIASPLPIE